MKNMQTPSHMFMAVRLDTTGNLERNLSTNIVKRKSKSNTNKQGPEKIVLTKVQFYLFEVVKKLSIVVTPRVTLAGSAFHSIQNVTKLEVTRIIPERRIIFSQR